jgi:hypothetical protein
MPFLWSAALEVTPQGHGMLCVNALTEDAVSFVKVRVAAGKIRITIQAD